MVKVKSFQGPQAIELANQLAQELREGHKIPAYVLAKPVDHSQNVQQVGLQRGHVRQYETAVVLAGDFPNEKSANKLLGDIRKIKPNCITEDMVSRYHWAVGVLTTAYLMPNPLLPNTKGEKVDPLILKLNVGENNLFNCPGTYTLQVRCFSGAVTFGNDPLVAEEKRKLERSRDGSTKLLEAAGEQAEKVTQELRKQGIEAYVFHGLSSSMVFVGSFSSPDDSRIMGVCQQVAGKRVAGFSLSSNPLLSPVPQK